MADDGQERRTPRSFQPPPWEAEQFTEARRTGADSHEPIPEPTASPKPEAGQASGEDRRANTDVARMDVMLMRLRSEEPSAATQYRKVGIAAGVFLLVLGLMLVVWGLTALAATYGKGAAGMVGASALLLMGGLFGGVGVWVLVKSTREREVA